jgi:hypothetical protein
MHVLWGIKDLHFNLYAHQEATKLKKQAASNPNKSRLALAQK